MKEFTIKCRIKRKVSHGRQNGMEEITWLMMTVLS